MALRPGSRLLMSSHFIPLPRNSIINASSSGDHFDCFFAGDSDEWAGWIRLAGTDGDTLAERGGNEVKGAGAATGAAVVVVIVAVIAGGPKTSLGGRLAAVVTGAVSSSSSGFRSNEISTLAEGSIAWFSATIICAFRNGGISTFNCPRNKSSLSEGKACKMRYNVVQKERLQGSWNQQEPSTTNKETQPSRRFRDCGTKESGQTVLLGFPASRIRQRLNREFFRTPEALYKRTSNAQQMNGISSKEGR